MRWSHLTELTPHYALRAIAIVCRMSNSLMGDAFAHHVWATLRVIDVCLELSPEQLETTVPGTYGSILDTVRHTRRRRLLVPVRHEWRYDAPHR